VLTGADRARAFVAGGGHQPPGLPPRDRAVDAVGREEHLVAGRVVKPLPRRHQRVSPLLGAGERQCGPAVEMAGHVTGRLEGQPTWVAGHERHGRGGASRGGAPWYGPSWRNSAPLPAPRTPRGSAPCTSPSTGAGHEAARGPRDQDRCCRPPRQPGGARPTNQGCSCSLGDLLPALSAQRIDFSICLT
jgi:hypothetical protein